MVNQKIYRSLKIMGVTDTQKRIVKQCMHFSQKHLRLPGSSAEEEVDCPTALELQKTSTGQLSSSLGGETVFSLNYMEAEQLAKKLQLSRENLPQHLSNVVSSAKKLSGYRQPESVNDPVFTGRFQRDGYVVEKYFLKEKVII